MGFYKNGTPRVINLITNAEGEMRSVVPGGAPVELSAEDLKNKHIKHLVDNGELIEAESAEDQALADQSKLEEAKATAASGTSKKASA